MKKANNVSTKGMPDGKEYKVNVYEPLFSEWVNHFSANFVEPETGDKELERFASDYNGHKTANNLASALKGAFKRVIEVQEMPEGEEKVKEAAKVNYAKARDLYLRVKNEETFDLRDFVSAKKREKSDKRTPLVQFVQVRKAILAKWAEASEEWKQGIIDKLEFGAEVEDSTTAALQAFEAKYCEPPLVNLDSYL